MFTPLRALLSALLLLFGIFLTPAYADDGIPYNCETASDDRINLFVRYEAHNRRLLLVDWTTGTEALIIDTDLPTLVNAAWSPDCRYLAVAVSSGSGFETVVYDLDTVTRVGTVPDARGKPHPLTWGPPPYLMVETRHGALLWNVQANVQLPLTTAYNTTTGRNFSRIRWDAAHHQVSVNLAVGGREVYDLRTGQQIPEAAHVTDSIRDTPNYSGTVTIGGKPYECQRALYTHRIDIPAVYVDFDPIRQTVFIRLRNRSTRIEALEMLEADLNASWFQYSGWTHSCRYFVGYLGVPGQDASDTVVWDIVNQRRLGDIPDARQIPHPVSSSPYEDVLFVQTRSGGILWHLPTNTQTQITTDVAIPLTGRSTVKNVEAYQWEPGHLLVQPLHSDARWDSYDVVTGQRSATGILQTPETEQAAVNDTTVAPPRPVEGQSGYYGTAYSTVCRNQFLRYDETTRSLILRDRTDRANIVVIETAINRVEAVLLPNCRWAYGVMEVITNDLQPYDNRPLDDTPRDQLTRQLIIWDTATWQRLFTLEQPYDSDHLPHTQWSPGGDRVLISTTNGSYLLNLITGEQILLIFPQGSDQFLEPRASVYWDYARGQIFISGRGQVHAFDLTTGVEHYRFTGGHDRRYVYFSVNNNQHLYIYSDWSENIWIWNLDTFNHPVVRLGSWGQRVTAKNISPDERYLAMGYVNVRVWDLTSSTDPFQHTPDAVYPVPGAYLYGNNVLIPRNLIVDVTFLDNTTLQITTQLGQITLMDISTGAILNAP